MILIFSSKIKNEIYFSLNQTYVKLQIFFFLVSSFIFFFSLTFWPPRSSEWLQKRFNEYQTKLILIVFLYARN